MEAVDGGTLERRGVGGLGGVDRTLLPLLLGHDRRSSMVYYYLPGEEFYFDIIIFLKEANGLAGESLREVVPAVLMLRRKKGGGWRWASFVNAKVTLCGSTGILIVSCNGAASRRTGSPSLTADIDI
jgi:hypothetical protein